MLEPGESLPAMARVEAAGSRCDPRSGVRGRTVFERAWRGLRAYELQTEPQELPEGRLVNHVVTLNLGSDLVSEARIDGQDWETHRTPHHGVGAIPADLPYATREHQAGDYLVVEIAPGFVESALGQSARRAELHPFFAARDPFAAHVMLALAEEARSGDGGSSVSAESLGTALVAHLVAREVRLASAQAATLPSPMLRRVLDHVSDHLDAPLSLQRLADLAGMDLFRFVRAFKQATGSSPHRYIVEARITRAKELLRDRSLSITEIALRTGFATPSHFSVTFRRLVNLTARAFRDGLR